MCWGRWQFIVHRKCLEHCRLHGNQMCCVTMQASMVDRGQWNRGKSCLEGMISHGYDSVKIQIK